MYHTFLHLKLSTPWYSTQLIEIFSYEVSLKEDHTSFLTTITSPNDITIYNLQDITFQERVVLVIRNFSDKTSQNKSVGELFLNANWLERETSEMSGVTFLSKLDTRNLLLTYCDATIPLRKSKPSIGFKEISFDSNNDVLVHSPLTLQI
jgi:NADH:ubiquinone oxidoreductase subunit C